MKSAHQTTVQTETHSQSSELLQQLSDLVDGFLSLSTPFKYSSGDEQHQGMPLDITDRLMVVTGVQHELPDRSPILS